MGRTFTTFLGDNFFRGGVCATPKKKSNVFLWVLEARRGRERFFFFSRKVHSVNCFFFFKRKKPTGERKKRMLTLNGIKRLSSLSLASVFLTDKFCFVSDFFFFYYGKYFFVFIRKKKKAQKNSPQNKWQASIHTSIHPSAYFRAQAQRNLGHQKNTPDDY